MKTVLINASPKRRFSVSGFLLKITGLFLKGEKTFLSLPKNRDYEGILKEIATADTLIVAMPLFVDTLPSHLMAFLRAFENYNHHAKIPLRVYCLANNGFIEGRQNEPLFHVMENFSQASGCSWGGGLGIGGGVMLNVIRLLLPIFFIQGLLRVGFIYFSQGGGWVLDPMKDFLVQILSMVLVTGWIFYCLGQLVHAINRQEVYGLRYTRILLPSFVFILIADLFFTLTSLFQGGLFRGWLAKKEPSQRGKDLLMKTEEQPEGHS